VVKTTEIVIMVVVANGEDCLLEERRREQGRVGILRGERVG
jgi:hypothetical protein